MTRSENGRGGPDCRTAPGTEADRNETRRRIETATDHLARLQQILLEMLCDEGAPVPVLAPRSAANMAPANMAAANLPAAHLSRLVLDQLACALGDPPLHNRPDLPRRGLQLVGGRDLPAEPAPLPLSSRIDQHLRLRLGGASNRVAVERLSGMRWQPLDLHGRKDGHGGVTLDLAALERLAGPVSPQLTRFLRPSSSPIVPPAPPCIDEG